ncbi:hypothetical protein ACJIZ3_013482 [Penstemon smallii]|uniref:Uncharacterized protein n=1 Tax=Penstemon smallii TaxID=265156 RepID=A0ABD3RGP5_9LAMI
MGQAIRKGVKLNSTACYPNRKLFMKKLRGNEKIPWSGSGPEFHHITEANTISGGFLSATVNWARKIHIYIHHKQILIDPLTKTYRSRSATKVTNDK